MADRTGTITAALAGTIDIGGDLPVNRFGFGAMRLTGPGIWGEPEDRDECKRVLRRALEVGINLIDTADSYGPEVSERLIAETLYPYPDELVIATKGGLTRPGPGRWVPDGRPAHLRAACDGSGLAGGDGVHPLESARGRRAHQGRRCPGGDCQAQQRNAWTGCPGMAAGPFAGDAAHPGNVEGLAPRGERRGRGARPGSGRPRGARPGGQRGLSTSGRDMDEDDEYDALDEALMETFPASDPIAVSAAAVRSKASPRGDADS